MVQISNHNNCADGTKTEIGLSYTVTFYTKYAGWYKFHCPLDVDFGAFILFNGDVVSATYDEIQSQSANSCMIEQAVKYAKMSRFSFDNKKSQAGRITYTFVTQ